MRDRGSDEQRGKGEPEQAPASERERHASHSRSDEVAGLDRGRANARHPETQLGRQTKAARAARERPAPGDEAEVAKSPTLTQTDGRNAPSNATVTAADSARPTSRRRPYRVDPAPEEEVPRHVDESAESEREPRRGDRQVVRLDEERAHVDERAGPAREGEELADRPARDARIRRAPMRSPARADAGGVARCRRRSTARDEQPSQTGIDEPGEPPVDLAEQSRRAASRRSMRAVARAASAPERETGRPVSTTPRWPRSRPSTTRRSRRPTSTCASDEHREVGRRAADQRAARESDERAEHEARGARRAPARSPVARAAAPAASPDTVRSCPAVAIETSRSRATSGSSGFSTTSAACDAASAASSAMPTARGPAGIR